MSYRLLSKSHIASGLITEIVPHIRDYLRGAYTLTPKVPISEKDTLFDDYLVTATGIKTT